MALKRFSPEEKTLLANMYNSGTSFKRICHELDRGKSSVCYALEVLTREGRITRNRLVGGRKEVSLYLSSETYDKVAAGAATKGCSMSRFIEITLRKVIT